MLKEVENVHIHVNGHLVSRQSDYIIYSVEAELIDSVVAQFAPCTLLSLRVSSGLWFAVRGLWLTAGQPPSSAPLSAARRPARPPRFRPLKNTCPTMSRSSRATLSTAPTSIRVASLS
jgi:hypothetical protein